MKERPMLFNGDMVRAILCGRKTQTRRVIRQAFCHGDGWAHSVYPDGNGGFTAWWGIPLSLQDCQKLYPNGGGFKPPWSVGDRLWVREAWKPGAWREDGRVAVDYRATPEITNTPWCTPECFDDMWSQWTEELMETGSTPDANGFHRWEPGKSPLKWRPSIHMPRWASRITLEITGVRVERLQDISEGDSSAEGSSKDTWAILGETEADICDVSGLPGLPHERTSYKNGFATLWSSINGPGSWDANPWVWVVEFERIL